MPTPAPGASEFDRFGPWIDEVATPDDVPPLYRDHPLDLPAATLVLKVPRDIPRRDATPDMDLYDHLLVLDAEGLTVLSRRIATAKRRGAPVERGYDVRRVAHGEVAAIRDVVSLLDGRLSIHTLNGAALTLRYNGSARANITRLVTALRGAAGARPASAAGAALLAAAGERAAIGARALDAGQGDVALVNDVREIVRHTPDLVARTCHGRLPLAPRPGGAAGLLRRALHSLSPAMLHGAVIGADDAAVDVVGRQEWVVRGRAPVHSLSRLVLPVGALRRVDVAAHETYPGVAVVRFGAGASTLEIAVPEGSAAHGLLSDAAARALATIA